MSHLSEISRQLQEMYEKYGQNVAFKAVFSTKPLKKSDVRQFSKEYSFTTPLKNGQPVSPTAMEAVKFSLNRKSLVECLKNT